MRKCARVIIIDNSKILLIHRIKHGREYYVLPGGGIEDTESPEMTAIREVQEEMSLDISIDKLLWEFEDEFNLGYYFLAKDFSGKLKLGGPEASRQSDDNIYSFEWVALERLNEINLVPQEIKNKILAMFNNIN